jgi:putative inorganic carbon (hco3(-)) transporter
MMKLKELSLKYFKQYFLSILLLAYILGDVYVLINKRPYFYPYNLLPLVFFVGYFAIFHLQKLILLLAFCTPLSFTLKDLGLTEGPNLSLPTEPLMAILMLMYILSNLHQPIYDRKFSRHPLTLLIAVQLIWMLITTFTAVNVVVSLKYFISRLWFIFSCYVIVQHLLQNRKNLMNLVMAYATALAIVVFYTITIHAQYNFNDKAADWVVGPFYNDHTAYGAALAMYIPVMLSFLFMKTSTKLTKIYALCLFMLFMLAIILSFARAGWLSLVVAIGILVTLQLKIKFRTLMLTLFSSAAVFFVFQNEILMAMGRNSTNAEGGFENNVQSVSNISTDASNLERLNRWSCALRMWKDKPVFGFGPGNYMFSYAPYQISGELTIISTNFGTGGNAHSEYLGPLAEQGILGMLLMVILLFYAASLGYRLVYSLADYDDRMLCTGLFLGLMTYFVHGLFNNFLDSDKLSLPFWSFLAAMVCFDIYSRKKNSAITQENPTIEPK